jgi:hypothetical protein
MLTQTVNVIILYNKIEVYKKLIDILVIKYKGGGHYSIKE